jgi:hypothetical protein
METKIYKSLAKGVSDSAFEKNDGSGVVSFVSWERLKPYIEHAVCKKPDEKIIGLRIDNTGINVKFERVKK